MTNKTEIIKPMIIADGIFLITEFSNRGGVAYHRIGAVETETLEHERERSTYTTRKEVDHIGLEKWAKKIINQAYSTMDRHCAHTPVGYWLPPAKSDALMADLAGDRAEAQKLNDHARSAGSHRRVTIEVYAVQIAEDLERTALRLAQTVHDRLDELRLDLLRGDLNAYAGSWRRARNLPALATGIQSEAIQMALMAARDSRAVLADKLRHGQDPVRAGADLDLGPIESAIFLFSNAVNGVEIADPAIDNA